MELFLLVLACVIAFIIGFKSENGKSHGILLDIVAIFLGIFLAFGKKK